MPAFASFETSGIPLGRSATPVGVYRSGGGGLEFLANVRVLAIQYREGADPGRARFRYVFDINNPSGVPNSFQDALSVDSNLPGVVANDDRLVVLATNPDGSTQPLFDGFAQVPELGLTPDGEMVTFLALGVAVREWDTPIGGALMRDADDPTVVSDAQTDVVARFNPSGLPNATPEGADTSDDSGNTYPTFLDPLVVRDPDVRRLWTLPMAIRYLCFLHNPGQTYVTNPDGSMLDALLGAPPAGDPKGGPIVAPDYPITGKAWPAAVQDLLAPAGFGMAFRVGVDGSGNPSTWLDIFGQQDPSSAATKDLYLQPRGDALDPGQSNLAEARLARDMSGVANAVTVESALIRYEASFVLAPGFPISASDTDGSVLPGFDKNDPNFSTTAHDAYRLYVFDETGEGHWDRSGSAMDTTPTPLSDLLGKGAAIRRRVPIGELFTIDPNRKPLRARLSISTDFAGQQPGLWDGSGTWQPVGGGFELLKDRLGVWINAPNPNSWNIQASRAPNMPYPAGVVRGVEAQASPNGQPFALRLTCVIEGDDVLSATADRRPSSPTNYTITRRVDARDRYAKQIVASGSEFNTGEDPIIVRDDGPDALVEACARRTLGEAGEVAGAVTIPRFTQAYRIGDRVASIRGRSLSLQTNAGAPTEEGQVFPTVVGLTWDFDGHQQTILQLSDQRGQRR